MFSNVPASMIAELRKRLYIKRFAGFVATTRGGSVNFTSDRTQR